MPQCDRKHDKALLTVVIPVYNRAHQVTDTLDSIIGGDVPALHIVAVDNNSTDNSLAVLEKWRERHQNVAGLKIKIVSEKKQGAASARNRGLQEVTTPWVEFFDSDDIMAQGHIAAIIHAVKKNPDEDILIWQSRLNLLSGKTVTSKTFNGDRLIDQIIHCPLATYNFAVRTSLFQDSGAWNDELRVWDDWETGVRLLLRNPGIRIKMIDTPGVDVRRQEESLTGTSYATRCGLWEQAIDAVCKEIAVSGLDSDAKQKAFLACNYRRAILAAEYSREKDNSHAHDLLKIALASEQSSKNRSLLRWAYFHTRLGLRGAWTIMSALRFV